MAWAPVCLSVRPSVTLLYCTKTVQVKITKSLMWTAPRTLVFCDKISCRWVIGFHSNENVKKGYPLKNVILPLLARAVWKRLHIGTDILLIITSTGDRLFRFINVDDLERPYTFEKGIWANFSLFRAATHILRVNCAEIAGDGPGQPAYEIFSIKRRF